MAASALEQALALAVGHHEAGRLADAAAVYRRVLQQHPGNAQALHYLGVMAHQVGRHEVAATLLERSVRAEPGNAGFRVNLGNLYFKQTRFPEAVAAYREALRLDPNHRQAAAHLKTALARGGGKAPPVLPAALVADPSPISEEPPIASPVLPDASAVLADVETIPLDELPRTVVAEGSIEPPAIDCPATPNSEVPATAPAEVSSGPDTLNVAPIGEEVAPLPDQSTDVAEPDDAPVRGEHIAPPAGEVAGAEPGAAFAVSSAVQIGPANETIAFDAPADIPVTADAREASPRFESDVVPTEPSPGSPPYAEVLPQVAADPEAFAAVVAHGPPGGVPALQEEVLHAANGFAVQAMPAAPRPPMFPSDEPAAPPAAVDLAPPLEEGPPFVLHVDLAPSIPMQDAFEQAEFASPTIVQDRVETLAAAEHPPSIPAAPRDPHPVFDGATHDPVELTIAWPTNESLADLAPAHVEPEAPTRGGRAAPPPPPPVRGLRQRAAVAEVDEGDADHEDAHRALALGHGFDRPFDPVDDTQSEFYVLHAADVPTRARDGDDDGPMAGEELLRGLNLKGPLPPSPRKLRKLRGAKRTSEVLELRKRADELLRRRMPGEAIELLKGVVALRPDSAKAHRDLGAAYLRNDMLGESVTSLLKALTLRPRFAEAYGSLGDAYHLRGQIDKAIECYQKVLSIKPSAAKVHSNLLLTLNYTHRFDPPQVFKEHQRWAELHALPLSASRRAGHDNDRACDRMLRIGYVSPDFRQHSVNYFVEPILANHDHAKFSITCYSDVSRPDAVTEQLNQYCDFWRDVRGMGDEEVANMVRADRIDILIDLSGHTGANRMGVFARKPAPVQATYLGYPNTTGMTTVDWRLTDARADPPGLTEHLNVERLVRLPKTFLCYQPPRECPEPGPAPCVEGPRAGQVTFGCFNVLAKVTPDVMALWAKILAAVPNSRLVMKGRVGALKYEDRRQYVLDIFKYHRIPASRLELLDKEPDFASHLQMYRQIDIVLDPFPYNGTTTTCEALWMGVPVIVLAGQSHVSRVGVSLLTSVGLPELCAPTPAEYVRKAVALANDPKSLTAFRKVQRERMRASPLMDAPRFTRTLEAAYQQMWEKWCAAPAAQAPELPVKVASTLTLGEE